MFPIEKKFFSVYEALQGYPIQKFRLLKAVLITVLMHSITIYIFYTIGREIGEVNLSISTYSVIVPIGILLLTFPTTPGGFGVGQGVFYSLFLWFGAASGNQGSSIITIYQVILLIFNLAFFPIYLINKKEVKQVVIDTQN